MSQTLREEQDKAYQLALKEDREKVINDIASNIAEAVIFVANICTVDILQSIFL